MHDHHDEHIHDHHDHGADHPHDHEHSHIHEHAHTHSDGVTHTHPHEHAHTHEHHHEHGEGKPLEELLALMKYMTGHNAAHTQELEALAQEVRDAGQDAAYDDIMEAVRRFTEGNAALARALEKMR